MPKKGGLTGRTIGDGKIRTLTSASVVAVMRGETTFPGPDPAFSLAGADKVLLMGSADSVTAAAAILTG